MLRNRVNFIAIMNSPSNTSSQLRLHLRLLIKPHKAEHNGTPKELRIDSQVLAHTKGSYKGLTGIYYQPSAISDCEKDYKRSICCV